ncbi:hypothetical protein FAI40_00760 [Acetobacteraceae bacterium]|nr:hypothetical protein FAI40_00760 [Acetobacteraceae bacterium]
MSKSFKIFAVAGAFLLAAPLAFAGSVHASPSDRALNEGDHGNALVGCHGEHGKHMFLHKAFKHGFPMNAHGCYYGSPFPFSLGSKIQIKHGHYLECVASKNAPISEENPLHWQSTKEFVAK